MRVIPQILILTDKVNLPFQPGITASPGVWPILEKAAVTRTGATERIDFDARPKTADYRVFPSSVPCTKKSVANLENRVSLIEDILEDRLPNEAASESGAAQG